MPVAGYLIIEPDIIGHGDIDMALHLRIVGHPMSRLRIQMQGLGFFPAVTAALPGEHGAFKTCR